MFDRKEYHKQWRHKQKVSKPRVSQPVSDKTPIETLVSQPKVSKPFVQEMRLKLDNGQIKKVDVFAMLKVLEDLAQ